MTCISMRAGKHFLAVLLLLGVSAQCPAKSWSLIGSLRSFASGANHPRSINDEPLPVSRRVSAKNERPQNPVPEKSKADATFAQAEKLGDEGSAESLKRAIEKYGEALLLYRALGDRSGEARTLNNIGLIYDDRGEKQMALQFYNQALPLKRAVGDRSGVATTLNNIGSVYDDLGEEQKALEFYNEALPIMQAIGDRKGEAVTLNNIGGVYDHLGEEEKALEFYNQALTRRRTAADRGGEAATLNNIGAIYYSTGEKEKALESYQQALPIFQALGNRKGEARTLGNIGLLYNSLGEKQNALEFYHRALTLNSAVGDREGEAVTLNNIAVLQDSLGEKQQALEFHNRALLLRRAIGDRRGEAGTLNNIGRVYDSLGEKQKALEFYKQALPIWRAVGDHEGEAAALNNIGSVCESLGEKQKALEFYKQALPILQALGNRAAKAAALNNIGGVYDSLGEWQKALEFYKQALLIWRAVGDRRGEATALNNIGLVYKTLGEKREAKDSYNQALRLCKAIGYRDGEATTLGNLMFLSELDKPALAIFYGKQAVNVLQQLRANLKGLEKELQRTFLHSKEDTYRTLASLLISQGRLAEAQQVLGLLKEEEYFEFVRRDAETAALTFVRISFTPAEAELEKRFSEIADRIADIGAQRSALLAIKQRTTEEEKRLSDLEAQLETANQAFQKFLDQLEAELKKAPGGSSGVVALRESQVLKDTLRELDAVAIYTIVGQERYYVILITPDVEKAYEYKITEADLNKKVFAFREVLQNPAADPMPLAQELYRILFGPELARDIAQTRKQTLLWSLDGTLRYLPVAALHDGRKYLVESCRNVMITLASHDHLKDPVSPKWQVLGLGVSKGEVIKGSNGPLIFPPLAGVREELAGIVRDETRSVGPKGILPGKVMLDEDFTTEAMKVALRLRGNEQPFKLVHIASHFNFEPGDETKSFLLLGGGKTLTLSQLKNLSQIFSRVELLTLSACNTATGGVGEGKEVEGFAVLAQRQGAEAIIATLWPVADPSTSQLMQRFYRLRDAHPGMSKAEAMRQAQLALLRPEVKGTIADNKRDNQSTFKADPNAPFAHPYYWAPFILIGNWR